MSNIIGISAFFHDSACALLQDGTLTVAVQEERLSRIKHDAGFPIRAFRACLAEGGLRLGDVHAIAYYEDPARRLSRQLWQFTVTHATEHCLSMWRRATRITDSIRSRLGFDGPIHFVPHHVSHAASAFHFSGFSEASVLVADAVGEWSTTTCGHGRDREITITDEVLFPHSLGLLYSALTSYLGFEVNDGEYKVMGLAAYGTPRFRDRFRALCELDARGSCRLNLDFFDFADSHRMFSDSLPTLFDVPPRRRDDPITGAHADIARSLQETVEEALLRKARWLHTEHGLPNLCLAGGVALNCVAVGRLRRETPFRALFVQPAAGDAGGAIGAATVVHCQTPTSGPVTPPTNLYLGPAVSTYDIRALAARATDTCRDYRDDVAGLCSELARRLAAGAIVGWFQGRMEFGPRALGARSILADPRSAEVATRINAHIKRREAFRPFAPVVLEEWASAYFDTSGPMPFMTETCLVAPGAGLAAVTHVDGTARVQTLGAEQPRLRMLLEAFLSLTGCPALLNTSFNTSDEPIVCSPIDALVTFARGRLDLLALDTVLITRDDLKPEFIEAADPFVIRPSFNRISDAVYTFA
jgi:carbamoyltransferase